MSSYFTLRHSLSINTLSLQRPFPSMLISTPSPSRREIHSSLDYQSPLDFERNLNQSSIHNQN
jgi:hypothetical protein